MAKYRISTPDGSRYEITAPNNASQAEVLAYAKANHKMTPAYDTSLKGRDDRSQMLRDPMIEGAKEGLKAALPSTAFNNPLTLSTGNSFMGVAKDAFLAAGETLRDPTRLSSTFSRPGQVAGEKVETGLENKGINSLLAKGAGFITSAALDPQSYMLGGLPKPKPGILANISAQEANKAAGISEKTIKAMTGAGKNPGETAVKLGAELRDAGVIKSTASKTWKAVDDLRKQAGKDVGTALDKISRVTSKMQEASDDVPHALDVKTSLEPLVAAWTERAQAMTSAKRAMAKPYEEIYTGLTEIAKKQNGKLTLDNIRVALDEVGPLVHKGSEETQAVMGELYGTLANMRDKMVEKIAVDSGNPTLAGELLRANSQYSKYIRILPDIAKATIKEGLGKGPGLAEPVKYLTKKAAPAIASLAHLGDRIAQSVVVKGTQRGVGVAGMKAIREGFPMPDSERSKLQSIRDKLKN